MTTNENGKKKQETEKDVLLAEFWREGWPKESKSRIVQEEELVRYMHAFYKYHDSTQRIKNVLYDFSYGFYPVRNMEWIKNRIHYLGRYLKTQSDFLRIIAKVKEWSPNNFTMEDRAKYLCMYGIRLTDKQIELYGKIVEIDCENWWNDSVRTDINIATAYSVFYDTVQNSFSYRYNQPMIKSWSMVTPTARIPIRRPWPIVDMKQMMNTYLNFRVYDNTRSTRVNLIPSRMNHTRYQEDYSDSSTDSTDSSYSESWAESDSMSESGSSTESMSESSLEVIQESRTGSISDNRSLSNTNAIQRNSSQNNARPNSVPSSPIQTNPMQPRPVPSNQTQPRPVPSNQTQPRPVPSNQTQPRPVPSNQTQPRPVPSNQTQPRPVPSNQTQPRPVQSNQMQPRPVQTNPMQPRPVQTNPMQPRPVQSNQMQPRPVQTNPTQPRPVQSNVVKQNPIQNSSIKTNPIQPSPIQAASQPKPVQSNVVKPNPMQSVSQPRPSPIQAASQPKPVQSSVVKPNPMQSKPIQSSSPLAKPVQTNPIQPSSAQNASKPVQTASQPAQNASKPRPSPIQSASQPTQGKSQNISKTDSLNLSQDEISRIEQYEKFILNSFGHRKFTLANIQSRSINEPNVPSLVFTEQTIEWLLNKSVISNVNKIISNESIPEFRLNLKIRDGEYHSFKYLMEVFKSAERSLPGNEFSAFQCNTFISPLPSRRPLTSSLDKYIADLLIENVLTISRAEKRAKFYRTIDE